MATRVTRSRKIDIAEDHTALATQTPLPDTPAKSAPLVAHEVNTMPSTIESVPSQVKQLKAAYRDAIGGTKRGKKGKGKSRQEHWEGNEENDNSRESPVPEATRQLLQSREGSLASLLEMLRIQNLTPTSEGVLEEELKPAQPVPTVRLTRHQLAKQQAGQYNISSIMGGSQSATFSASGREHSYLDSLFGGRRPGGLRRGALPEELFNYEDMTDKQHLELAEEAGKPTQEDKPVSKEVKPKVHDEATSSGEDGNQQNNEAEVNISIQTPAKPVKTLDEVEKACVQRDDTPTVHADEDSFVEQITCRSPAKPVSRIEDSVEALDQLEEALEALDQAALTDPLVPAETQRKKARPAIPATIESLNKSLRDKVKAAADAVANASGKASPPKRQPQKSGFASMRVKSTTLKQRPSVKKATSMTFRPVAAETDKSTLEQPKVTGKAPAKRPISLLPPKEPVKSTKPPTRSTFELPGEAVARKLKEQREARLAQRESSQDSFYTARTVSEPKTIKSSKPPTKSNFELPGEALSRRKKEAHEARLKAQEEEERQRREFKAKPVRKSVGPNFVPRDTVASRARQSRVGLENMETGELSVSKRGSNVGAHRPSLQSLANTSAHRAPGPNQGLTRKPSTTSGPSMTGLHMQRTVSDKEVFIQRQRAKEIYNRDAKWTEDMGKEKQEREAAAKRAREEAAERGRQASREWAEKHRTRTLAGGDKGMSAGYGPGGQMGLST
ncbi:hypothetical protein LSUE1_G003993 [Lachnellula suecica]|uniref:Carboxylesterase family protein n=1 Tax=Lachnellula suecica TaxID=602035 RepID=A0A8T9C907_9HELO|nr:hypothetical protein LSUE1_G003993 [Lachnellula suecica]